MTNHYTDVCEETIESLRQQLAEAYRNIKIANAQTEEFERKWYLAKDALEDSQKRVMLLRDAILRTCCNSDGVVCLRGSYDGRTILQEALAATKPERNQNDN